MEELRKDVFRYGRKLDSPSLRPLALVHPWYKGEKALYNLAKFEKPLGDGEDDYLVNLERLIANSSLRNIFLFEENPESNVSLSCDRIAGMRKSSLGIYAVSTKDDRGVPECSSWKEILKSLPNLSDGVDIAGGAVFCATGGCAGGVYLEFTKEKINAKFVEDCCFC